MGPVIYQKYFENSCQCMMHGIFTLCVVNFVGLFNF